MKEVTSLNKQTCPIPRTHIAEQELCDYRAEVKNEIFRSIRSRLHDLKQSGFTQKDLARRLDMDAAQLSRQLRGSVDLMLESLSDLARGVECRLDVSLTPFEMVPKYFIDIQINVVSNANIMVRPPPSTITRDFLGGSPLNAYPTELPNSPSFNIVYTSTNAYTANFQILSTHLEGAMVMGVDARKSYGK